MSTVGDRIGPPAPVVVRGPGQRPRVVLYAAVVAGQAAAASLVAVLVPVVLAWATASYSKAPWTDVVHFGVGAWLLAHHAGIVITDGRLGLVPAGLLIVPLVSCWFGGARLARGLDPKADQIRAGVGRARPKAPPPKAIGVFVFTYAGIVTAVAAIASSSDVRPLLGQAFAGSLVIAGLAGAAGLAAWVAGGVLPGLRLLVDRTRAPRVIRRCLRPVLLGLAVQLTGSLILLLVAGGLGWSRITALHGALGAGLFGGIVLTFAQLLVVPNLVVWAGSYAAGAGFSVGTGTTVAPGKLDLGALPALPVLGALPSGAGPQQLWMLMAIPVLGGVVTGIRVLRMPLGRNFIHVDASATRRAVERVPHHVRVTLVRSVVATGLMVLAWALLGWLAGGPAGPGRLGTMGPDVPRLVARIAIEAGGAIVLTVVAGLTFRSLTGRSPAPESRIPAARRPAGAPRPPDPITGRTPVAGVPTSRRPPSGTARRDPGDPLSWLDRPRD